MNDQNTNGDPARNEWEHEMTDAFDRRVRDLHEAPLTFDHVRGTAMKIRRKRRAAVAGSMLAAAAVIVPVAVVASNSLGGDSGTIPPTTQGPTEGPTDGPTDGTDTDSPVLDPSPIAIPFLAGSTLTLPDGSTFQMPSASYRVAAVLGDRIVGYRNEDAVGTVDVIDQSGISDSWSGTSELVVSDSGETVAFVSGERELITLWDGGQRTLGSRFSADVSPVAVAGGPSCDVADCRVYLDAGDAVTAPVVVDSEGKQTTVVPGTIKVNDVLETLDVDLVALQVSYSNTGSCSAVYANGAAQPAFETCDYLIEEISPDRQHLLVSDAYGDGIGLGYFAVIDFDGTEVARYAPEGGFIGQLAWETADTVVATVFDGAGWRIVRQPVSGGLDYPLGPAGNDEAAPSFYLP